MIKWFIDLINYARCEHRWIIIQKSYYSHKVFVCEKCASSKTIKG